MTEYLIRTSHAEKKTYLIKNDAKDFKYMGIIYTDFLLNPGTRDISLEDIADPKTNKTLAQLQLGKTDRITVYSKGKEIAAYAKNDEYRENGTIITYTRTPKSLIISRQEYKHLEEMGLTHVFYFQGESSLGHVLCFEKDKNLAGLVYAKEREDELSQALRGLVLVLASRIESQEYILEFLRK